jgi:hypothetical protein
MAASLPSKHLHVGYNSTDYTASYPRRRYSSIINLHNQTKHKEKHDNKTKDKQKLVSFTYTGSDIRTITKSLKNTNIKIAFTTTNTVGNT